MYPYSLRLCLTVISVLFLRMGYSQDVSALASKALQQEKELHEIEALKTWQQVIRLQPADLTALCHASELCSRIGYRQTTESAMTDYYRGARKYAEIALKINKENPDANAAMAIAIGRMALIADGKERVAAIRDIRIYGEEALKADKNHYKALHILGKWNLELASLNGFQRNAVKMFYGDVPDASFQDAIRYFELSKKQDPGFLLNYLELAKAFERSNQRAKAREQLNLMLQLPDRTEEDAFLKKKARALLARWKA